MSSNTNKEETTKVLVCKKCSQMRLPEEDCDCTPQPEKKEEKKLHKECTHWYCEKQDVPSPNPLEEKSICCGAKKAVSVSTVKGKRIICNNCGKDFVCDNNFYTKSPVPSKKELDEENISQINKLAEKAGDVIREYEIQS